jgi:hypothetical protein
MTDDTPHGVEKHKSAERCHWAIQNITQCIAVVINVSTLIAVIISVCFSYGAFQEAHRQANAAQKSNETQFDAFKADQRPWIGGPSEIIATINSNKTVSFRHIFRNIGKSVARNFYIDGKIIEMYPRKGDKQWSLSQELHRICGSSSSLLKETSPEHSALPEQNWVIDLIQMPASVNPVTFDELNKMEKPVIVGCVVYRSFDDSIHQTGYYASIHIDIGGQNSGIIIAISQIYTVIAD